MYKMYRQGLGDYIRATRTIHVLGINFFLQMTGIFLTGICTSAKLCGSEYHPLGD